MRFLRRIMWVGVLAAIVAAIFGLLNQRATAAETGFYVESNGRWHVNGETFWFGAPGDVFLSGPSLEFNVEGASDYAVWRDGEFFIAGDLVGNVRETVHIESRSLPSDIPVVTSFAFGAAPSFIGYIRDDIAYYRNLGTFEEVRFIDEDVQGSAGQSLAARPPILVPVGKLRQALDDAMGHPLLDWRLRLDGQYTCETEGPGDIIVPAHTSLEAVGGSSLTLCLHRELIVQDSSVVDLRVNGSIITRGESDLEDISVDGHPNQPGVLVESGVTRFVDSIGSSIEVLSLGELRVDESQITDKVILRTTQPVVFIDSLVGVRPYREPMRLGEIVFLFPDRFAIADVTLIDSQAEYGFVSVTCIDFYETFC